MPYRISLTLAIVAFAMLWPVTGTAQELDPAGSSQKEEVQAILREASGTIPKSEDMQQFNAAAQIAGLQARAGDLGGALATARIPTSELGRSITISSIVRSLADRGDTAMAFDAIELSGVHDRRAGIYVSLAGQLAEKHDFKGAFRAAGMIENKVGLYSASLMQIYEKQREAGDRQEAAKTLEEALAAIERCSEKKDPPEFKLNIVQMYRYVVGSLTKSGNREQALEVIGRIQNIAEQEQDPSQKLLLVEALADSKLAVGDLSLTLETAEKLPPGAERDRQFLAIVQTKTTDGDPYSALQEAARISDKFWHLYALQLIAATMAFSGNYTQALITVNSIPAGPDRAKALAALAFEEAENGDSEAGSTLALAQQAAMSGQAQTEPDTFEMISEVKAMLGDFPEAIMGMNNMDEKSRAHALWTITANMVSAGKKKEALALAEMQHAPYPKVNALIGIASTLMEQIDEANKSSPAK